MSKKITNEKKVSYVTYLFFFTVVIVLLCYVKIFVTIDLDYDA